MLRPSRPREAYPTVYRQPPSRSQRTAAMTTPNVSAFGIPLFASVLIADVMWAYWRGRRCYDLADTLVNCVIGICSVLTAAATGGLLWIVGEFLWAHRWLNLGTGLGAWVVAFVAADFVYYWGHRLSHSCRWYWAAHVVHHSSGWFNYSTALRHSWTPTILNVHLLAAPLGIRPELVATVNGLGLIYQFFIHTPARTTLGPLEWILNTPSHHRVHHGSNSRYVDRNFGGTLIIWDRVFGTFASEDDAEPARFGVTPEVHSHNPLWLVVHEYVAIASDVWRASTVLSALQCLIRVPSTKEQTDS